MSATPPPPPMSAAVVIAANMRGRLAGRQIWPDGRLVTPGEAVLLLEELDRTARELARVTADNRHIREEKRLIWGQILVPRWRRVALEVAAWVAIALFIGASGCLIWLGFRP